MANSTYQETKSLQEWAPLTYLLEKLPSTINLGFFTYDINFTCIDIIAEFIAVGTNHGIVYWFNRKTQEIETLGCQNLNSAVTCIRIVSTVDYMVAAGNNQGVVTIFQVPKQLPDSLPENWKPAKKKQVERFIISGLHKVSITAVEWSKNGMKLFSGDQSGLVVQTEMDFYMHLSKSAEFLNETYSVVQLSYQNGLLLISTLFRSIIVDGNNNNKIKQVGQKERKILGKFGAVFFKNKNHLQGPIIYATRPGLRIWQADKNGIVLKNLNFKEANKITHNEVKLLNPVSNNSKKKIEENKAFSIILPFSDDLLVIYNDYEIYFINRSTNEITSVITNLRKITNVACFKDEIFILEGERNILRIGYYPEIIIFNREQNQHTDLRNISESKNRATSGFTSLKTKIKLNASVPAYLYDKIKPTNIIQAISIPPTVEVGIDTSSIIKADEAVEVPPSVPTKLDNNLAAGVNLINNQTENCSKNKKSLVDRNHIFQKIGEQEFEEIVFNPQRNDDQIFHKTDKIAQKQIKKMAAVNSSIKNINFHENKINTALAESKNLFQQIESIDTESTLEPKNNLEIIEKSIQDKEKLLFNYLNLDLSMCMNKNTICDRKSNSSSSIDFIEHINDSYNIDRNCESLVL